jgi:hypothetical protein
MGSLVAVAAGVRDRSRTVLLKTLPPIAGGHALSIFVAAFLVTLLRSVQTTRLVAVVGGVVLVGSGLWRAFSRRHDQALGFRLSGGQLVVWSFLMSSVHGAGLALLPILVATRVDTTALAGHVHGEVGLPASTSLWIGSTATLVHTASMIAVTGAVALLVFELTGLRAPRITTWLNLDLMWAFALVGSGILTAAFSLIA